MIKSQKTTFGDWVVVALCTLLIIVCILPIINLAAQSLSSSDALIRNEVTLWPKGFNLDAYKTVLGDAKFIRSMGFTAILTVVSTFTSLFMTIICAYPFVYENLKGRKFLNTIIILTMYFNAGTIPHYLLLKDINLLNNPLVLVIPGTLSVFNMIIMRNFLYGVPDSLRESAQIDGATFIQILIKIYLPLSKPVLATLSLFYAVGRWNGFSDALMYMSDKKYHPIQLLLYNILNNVTNIEIATQEGFSTPGLSLTLKAASVMIATIPILLVYPWLQKYFISGVTLGAVKE